MSNSSLRKPFRDTRQRNAIMKALKEAGRPLGPKEILQLASREVPNLGIATVYRNVKALVENDVIEVVDLPGDAPRYSLKGSVTNHLFICEKTDSVFNLDVNAEGFDPKLPEGFRARDYRVIYYGERVPQEAVAGHSGNGRNGY